MSYYDKHIGIDTLVGQTITKIRIENDAVFMTLNNDREVYIEHEQDCCESVQMIPHDDSFLSLTGEIVTAASHDTDDDIPASCKREYMDESHTHTIITLSAGDKVVKLEWFGESNGYYGEGVSVCEKEPVDD